MTRPNVFGTLRCPTSALAHTLRGHDGVFVGEVKQPHFYSRCAGPSAAGRRERFGRGVAR